jgi:hypothetical protein
MRTLVLTAAIALLPMLAGCNKPKPKATVPETIVPEYKLTVDEFVEDYKKNQIGADQKYKGKVIQLTGKVSDIGKLPLAGYYIDLASSQENDLFGVKCILDKDDEKTQTKAGTLKAGDTVTIVGKCEGKAAGQALYLKPCFIPE